MKKESVSKLAIFMNLVFGFLVSDHVCQKGENGISFISSTLLLVINNVKFIVMIYLEGLTKMYIFLPQKWTSNAMAWPFG